MKNRLAVPLIATWLVIAFSCSSGGDGDSPAPSSDAPSDASVNAPMDVPLSESDDQGATDTPDDSPIETGTAAQNDDDDADELPDVTDDGPGMQTPVGVDGDTASIAGFWDLSSDSADGRDTLYVDIARDGAVTGYDYQADATGSGADCYLISNASIAARGDDRYDIANSSALPGARSPDDVIIVVENGSIVFRYLGDAFDPDFGEGQAGIEERFASVASAVTGGLAACDDT